MAYNILVKGEDITKMKVEAAPNVTKEYIISKCRHDANFVVRMVCDETEKA